MKITKKQIEKAFIEWNTFVRLDPDNVETDKEVRNKNVKQLAKEQTEYFLSLIK